MSYASQILRGYYTTPFGSGGEWSGGRKLLTTDAYGNLNAPYATLLDVVIGASYYVGISGPVTPISTLITATLDVDTTLGSNVFSLAGTINDNGTDGSYSIDFFITPTLTGLLSVLDYVWSIKIVSSNGDVWVPVNGYDLVPQMNYAT